MDLFTPFLKYISDTSNCIILSDYSKGFLTNRLIESVIKIANENGIKVLVDPKSPPFNKYKGAYLIKPNRKEAIWETGINIIDNDSLLLAAKKIQNETLSEVIVITLSEDGLGVLTNNELTILSTQAKEIFDVTGAGDTFIATLGYSLTIGKSLKEACNLANHAAGIVIGKQGCVPIDYKEIESIIG